MQISFSTILNAAGLTVSMLGTAMMFSANPNIDVRIGELPNGADLKRSAENKKRTRLFKFGMGVLMIGFLLQLAALFVQSI